MVIGRRLYGDGICFATTFLELIPSTPLNGSLRKFNTLRVSVGNRTLWREFLGIGTPILGPKTTYFLRLRNSVATLRAKTRTVVFTRSPKSSSAWRQRRRPSC